MSAETPMPGHPSQIDDRTSADKANDGAADAIDEPVSGSQPPTNNDSSLQRPNISEKDLPSMADLNISTPTDTANKFDQSAAYEREMADLRRSCKFDIKSMIGMPGNIDYSYPATACVWIAVAAGSYLLAVKMFE